MATTIDSLVVELGLDPKKFTQGQREAIEKFKQGAEEFRKHGSKIEGVGKNMEEALDKVRTQALGLLALFVGGLGIEQLLTRFANVVSQTGRMAQAVGV